MRRLTLLSFAFALLLPLSVFSAKTKKAVYVILDGIPADVIERLDPPAIKAVAAEGGYSRAYCGGTVGRYDQTPDHFGRRLQLHPDGHLGQQARSLGQFSETGL